MDGSAAFATVGGGILVNAGTSSFTQDVQQNVGNRGLIVYPFISSAGGGTVLTSIYFRDRQKPSNDFPILSTLATSAAGPVTPLILYPGTPNSNNVAQGYPLAGNWYIKTNVSGTVTYSLSYDILP